MVHHEPPFLTIRFINKIIEWLRLNLGNCFNRLPRKMKFTILSSSIYPSVWSPPLCKPSLTLITNYHHPCLRILTHQPIKWLAVLLLLGRGIFLHSTRHLMDATVHHRRNRLITPTIIKTRTVAGRAARWWWRSWWGEEEEDIKDFDFDRDDDEGIETLFRDFDSERKTLIFNPTAQSYLSMILARSSYEVMDPKASRSSTGNWKRHGGST